MRVNRLIKVAGAAVVAALCLPVALGAQTAQSLGSITLAKPVMADGQPLAAGTYTLRVSADTASAGWRWQRTSPRGRRTKRRSVTRRRRRSR